MQWKHDILLQSPYGNDTVFSTLLQQFNSIAIKCIAFVLCLLCDEYRIAEWVFHFCDKISYKFYGFSKMLLSFRNLLSTLKYHIYKFQIYFHQPDNSVQNDDTFSFFKISCLFES